MHIFDRQKTDRHGTKYSYSRHMLKERNDMPTEKDNLRKPKGDMHGYILSLKNTLKKKPPDR